MKKLIPLIAGFLLGFSNPATAKEFSYNEKNIGVCMVGYWCEGGFPGMSYLRVKTKTKGKAFSEFQYGVAFPTILTAKAVTGVQLDNSRIGMGLRLYPLAIGPQMEFHNKKRSLSISVEACYGYYMDPVGILFTLGFRKEPKVIRL
tara:strand:+ start:2029 stop:2466 length:438 start_codon:yes stop_codon:yes gene_type:complete